MPARKPDQKPEGRSADRGPLRRGPPERQPPPETDRVRAVRRDMSRIKARLAAAQPTTQALFTDDPDRARRLAAALADVRRAFEAAARTHALAPADQRQLALRLLAGIGPEAGAATLPETPPERWRTRDLNRRENPPQFVRRVYAAWLGRGLARRDLARLDEDLYNALSIWISRHPGDAIAAELPPRSDLLDGVIGELESLYPRATLRKLGHALDARMRRQEKSSKPS